MSHNKKQKQVDELLEQLSNPDPEKRIEAAQKLRHLGHRDAVEGLIKAMKDEHNDVRSAAASAFMAIKDARAVPSLIEASQDEARQVRYSAVCALRAIQDPLSVPALIESLSDQDIDIRKAAIYALGRIGDDTAVLPLIEVLKEYDTATTQITIQALNLIPDQRAVPALIEALHRGFYFAPMALSKFGSEDIAEELSLALSNSMDTETRSWIKWALIQMGDAAMPVILRMIQSDDWLARRTAARVLGDLGSKKGLPFLMEATEDEDWIVRWAAVEAVGKSKHPDSVVALSKALSDSVERIREEASLALGATKVHERLQTLALKLHVALERSRAYRISTSPDEFLAALNPHKSNYLHSTAKQFIEGSGDPWNILLTFPASLIGFLEDRLYAGSWDVMDGAEPLFRLFESLCAQVGYEFEWQFDEEAGQLHFRFDEHNWSVECQSLRHIDEPLSFSKIEPNMYDYLEEKGWTLFPVALDSVQEFYLIPNEGVSHIRDLIIPSFRRIHPLYDERIMWYFEGLPEDKRPEDPWDLFKGPIPE